MLRRLPLVFFLSVLPYTSAFTQEDHKPLILSLSDCEQIALENNLSVESAELRVKVSEAKLTQAKHARILPKFTYKHVLGPINRARAFIDPDTGFPVSPDTTFGLDDLRYFTQIDVDFIQPLFTFGRLSALASAASYGVAAEEANLLREKEGVRFQVRQLYWGLVLGKELLALIQDMDQELTKAENTIEEKLDEGAEDVEQTDLYKVQIFRYEVNKRLREAVEKVNLGKAALRTTLRLDGATDFDVEARYLEPVEFKLDSLETYYDMALANRPELAQLKAGVNARYALLRAEKSQYYPQFFLGGKISYNFAKDRYDPRNPFVYNPFNYFRPGLVLGVNLNLNFWQTRDRVRLAEAEYVLLAQKERLLRDGIKLEIQKTYSEVVQARANMKDSRRALRASENWLRATSMSWDLGVGEISDLIDAYKANSTMKGEHFNNIYKYNVAVAKLSKVIGRDLYPEPTKE